jgi:PilZ domain-containing protein
MSALQREAVGMPAAGARITLATVLGASDALVIESVEGDVTVLSDGCGLHKGAKANTRIYDGERVWHLTFCVRERHELRPGQARVALALSDRTLLGEERRLPRVACHLAATARRAGDDVVSAWARVLDVSPGGIALRAGVAYGAGELIDVDLDDGTGAVISVRLEVVDLIADAAGGIARARIVAVADEGAQRLGALVDRLLDSPSDGDPGREPLPALREALAAERRPAA